MDMLVHPSRFEGKSNTIDEALYYNIPVVATNFETVYEQITDGQTGFIVEMKPEFIASKIEMLNQHRAKLIDIKNNLSGQSKDQVSKGQEFISTINKAGN